MADYITNTNEGRTFFMKYKFIKFEGVLRVICLAFLLSCNLFDDDEAQFQKVIVGHIRVEKLKSDFDYNLVLKQSNTWNFGIIEGCTKVYFDTLGKDIFVEEYLNTHNSNYYQIRLLDSLSTNPTKAFKKVKITEKDFQANVTMRSPIFTSDTR